jgi:hypothetical protein
MENPVQMHRTRQSVRFPISHAGFSSFSRQGFCTTDVGQQSRLGENLPSGEGAIMSEFHLERLSLQEMEAELATPLPAKEVISLLDLNVDLNLALDLAAPIDLAVAANANVAAPINAGVSANVASVDSTSGALADQGVMIDHVISGSAIAHAPQNASVDQSSDVTPAPAPEPAPAPAPGSGIGALDGNLLNVNVNVDLKADLAAPIAGAVAANANVAAPINASAAANVLSVGSQATAVATQDAIITQHLDGVLAEANAEQQAQITQ